MGFEKVQNLDADTTVTIGGYNKKLKKENPTSIEGYYLGSRVVQNKLGPSTIWFLQTETGNVGVWGKTDMNRKLAAVTPGTMIRITHEGSRPTPKGDMLTYTVEVDKANTIEVNIPQAAAQFESAGNDEDTSDEDEAPLDEAPPARASRPAQPANVASAAQQAKVKAMLNNRVSK
jgi:hypothetical protein